jgi:hypothetical protein
LLKVFITGHVEVMNSSIDWFELTRRLFETAGRKKHHINELVEAAVSMGLVPFGESPEGLAKSLGSFLARNARSKTPIVSKVPNNKGGYLKGVYRLKPQKNLDLTPVETPKVSSLFTGAAGEFAVLSELLFRGFNASKMTVDDGIDIVASKDDKYFHIQVKTANHAKDRPYQASIRSTAFQFSHNVFYIVVMREPTPVGYVNRYAIFPSSEIRRWIAQGVLKEGASISLRIDVANQKFVLGKKIDVTHQINDFESIC